MNTNNQHTMDKIEEAEAKAQREWEEALDAYKREAERLHRWRWLYRAEWAAWETLNALAFALDCIESWARGRRRPRTVAEEIAEMQHREIMEAEEYELTRERKPDTD